MRTGADGGGCAAEVYAIVIVGGEVNRVDFDYGGDGTFRTDGGGGTECRCGDGVA